MAGPRGSARAHLASAGYVGLRLLGTRQGVAVDRWEALDFFIRRELGADAARLLAEPEPLGDGRYDWYATVEGHAEPLSALPEKAQRSLLAAAEHKLDQLRRLAKDARADNRNHERREFGEMLWAALAVPPERVGQSLYRVGDEPVLINWGARLDRPDAPSGPLVIKLPPLSAERRFPWEIPLWTIFATMAGALFVELVDGCVLGERLGIGPNFCTAPPVAGDPALDALMRETAALDAQLDLLIRASLQAPLCSRDAPAFVPVKSITQVPPYVTLPPKAALPAGGAETAALHRELNDQVRGAGGGICPGIEVIASWNQPANVDLRLYCLEDAAGETIAPDAIVDAYNPESCDARWDLGSDGAEAETPFVERICIGLAEDTGPRRFLATVFREDTQPGPVAVTLYARSGETFEQITVEARPGVESEIGLPIAIQ